MAPGLGKGETNAELVKTSVERARAVWVETPSPSYSLLLGGPQGPSGWGLVSAHWERLRAGISVPKKCFRSQWDIKQPHTLGLQTHSPRSVGQGPPCAWSAAGCQGPGPDP